MKRGRFEEFQAADVSINETKCLRISFEAFSGKPSNELSQFQKIFENLNPRGFESKFWVCLKLSFLYFELKLILFFRHYPKYKLVFPLGPNLLNIIHPFLFHSNSNDECKTEVGSGYKYHFFQMLNYFCSTAGPSIYFLSIPSVINIINKLVQ